MAEGGDHTAEVSFKGSSKELVSCNVIILLREKGFRFKNNWKTIATKLKFPLEKKSILSERARRDNDYEYPLEESVDYWIRNGSNPSWENLILIIADVDRSCAKHMRDSLGLLHVVIQDSVLESLTESHLMQMGPIPLELLPKLEAEGILMGSELGQCDTWKGVIEYARRILKDDKERIVKLGKLMHHYKETATIGKKIVQEEGEDSASSIAVSPTYKNTFDQFTCGFASLMDKIRPKLLSCLPSFKTFRRFVKNSGLSMRINDCEDNDDLLDIVEEMSDFLNLAKLEAIARHYNCQEVLDDIKEYNDTIDQSCVNIRYDLLQRSSLITTSHSIKDPLLCERIEFALHWDPDHDTFEKIRFILWKAFENVAKEIVVVRIDPGSIVVLCYIPHTLVPIAVYNAKKNLESLQKLGMMRLSIGYVTVLEEKGKELEEEEEDPVMVEEMEESVTKDEQDDLKELLGALEQKLKEKEEECKILQEDRDKWKLLAGSSGDQLTNKILNNLSEKEKLVESLRADNKLLLERNKSLETERDKFKEKSHQLSQELINKSDQLKSVVSHNEKNKEELERQIALLQEKLDSLSTLHENESMIAESTQQQIEAQKEEIAELKQDLGETQSLVKEKDSLIAEQTIAIDSQGQELDKLERDLKEAQNQIHERDSLIDKHKKEINELKESLKDTQSQVSEKDSFIAKVRKQIDEQRRSLEDTHSQELDEVKAQLEMQKRMVKSRGLENEDLNREKKDLIERLHQQLPTLHDDWKDNQTPPVQVIMTSFDDRKRSNEHWYSPSFLSHQGGYRMCLKVRPNGEEEGEGTHLSVSVHLMAGEHDDNLPWPFRGTIKIEVVNRRHPGGNFKGEIVFSDESNQEASQRVFNGIPVKTGIASFMGQGGIKFMPQETLYLNTQDNTEYVRDDSIKLNIVSVTIDSYARTVIPTLPPTSSNAVLEFKIDNFEARKRSNAECISEPFYSGPERTGYKFALLVYPNGRGAYKGNSISVFVHLMKGENDQRLRWPFRGEFIAQLVNFRKDQNHVEKLIEFSDATDPTGKYGARVAGITTYFSSGRSFQGYGFPNFVSHEYLESNEDRETQYLSDDGSLMLRIMKITVHS